MGLPRNLTSEQKEALKQIINNGEAGRKICTERKAHDWQPLGGARVGYSQCATCHQASRSPEVWDRLLKSNNQVFAFDAKQEPDNS